ncbi:Ataxin-2 like protein [Dictyocoela muelleri]|nr:Ataxin-2 like protein [Dictyocoela muelleri]
MMKVEVTLKTKQSIIGWIKSEEDGMLSLYNAYFKEYPEIIYHIQIHLHDIISIAEVKRTFKKMSFDGEEIYENEIKNYNQFEYAERVHGIKSEFDETFYTTELDKNSDFYKKNIGLCKKLAKDILQDKTGTRHQLEERGFVFKDDDDEAMYSSVQQKTNDEKNKNEEKFFKSSTIARKGALVSPIKESSSTLDWKNSYKKNLKIHDQHSKIDKNELKTTENTNPNNENTSNVNKGNRKIYFKDKNNNDKLNKPIYNSKKPSKILFSTPPKKEKELSPTSSRSHESQYYRTNYSDSRKNGHIFIKKNISNEQFVDKKQQKVQKVESTNSKSISPERKNNLNQNNKFPEKGLKNEHYEKKTISKAYSPEVMNIVDVKESEIKMKDQKSGFKDQKIELKEKDQKSGFKDQKIELKEKDQKSGFKDQKIELKEKDQKSRFKDQKNELKEKDQKSDPKLKDNIPTIKNEKSNLHVINETVQNVTKNGEKTNSVLNTNVENHEAKINSKVKYDDDKTTGSQNINKSPLEKIKNSNIDNKKEYDGGIEKNNKVPSKLEKYVQNIISSFQNSFDNPCGWGNGPHFNDSANFGRDKRWSYSYNNLSSDRKSN